MQKQKRSKRINCLGHGRVRSRAEGSRQRLSLLKHANYIGGPSAVALGLLALALISPNVTEGASADTRATVRANVTPVMSIALDNPSIDINLTPSTSGAYNAGSSKLTVNTNNASGYQLYMQTSSGEATLVSKNDQKIMPMTGSEFTDNTWGYSLGSGFAAVPATETSIMNKASSGVDTYDLSFGVKVNSTIPSGTYTNEVILSAVANPTTLTDMMDLFYMQDMTSTLCANTQGTDGNAVSASLHNEPSKQLIDIRDGKTYWVSKLADGNCWMVQNLALDIPTSGLKAADTDITADWTDPSGATITEADFSQDTDSTNTYSWNLGKYVLAIPTTGITCHANPTDDSPHDDTWDSLRPNQELSQCQNVVDVSGANWMPTYTAQTGTWMAPNGKIGTTNVYQVGAASDGSTIDTLVAVKCDAKKTNGTCDTAAGGEYDPHYLIGNYYQWNTATAGTGGTITNQRASGSICPKNWQLPSADGGVARNATDIANISDYDTKYGKTFTKLFTSYGFEFPKDLAPNIYGPNEQNGYNVATGPFYFARGGNEHSPSVSLRGLGANGFYWSSATPASETDAYQLSFNHGDRLTPSSPWYADRGRFAGLSVRCVAR